MRRFTADDPGFQQEAGDNGSQIGQSHEREVDAAQDHGQHDAQAHNAELGELGRHGQQIAGGIEAVAFSKVDHQQDRRQHHQQAGKILV